VKRWRLPLWIVLALSLTGTGAHAQLPIFVKEGYTVTYTGQAEIVPQGATVPVTIPYSQIITVDTVDNRQVAGRTTITAGCGNTLDFFCSESGQPISWQCYLETSSCSPPAPSWIVQFWVNPTSPANAAASIQGPNGEKYHAVACQALPDIDTQLRNTGITTCLRVVMCKSVPPDQCPDPGAHTEELTLAYDTTGLVRYVKQYFTPSTTFDSSKGPVGVFTSTPTLTIPWQVAGPNLLLQADTGEVNIWQPSGTRTSIETPDASWHIISTNYIKSKQNFDVLWQNNNGAIAIWEFNGISGTNRVLDGVVGMAAPGWRAVGLGDFFGRGVSDILFQNNSGEITIWEMNGLQPTPRIVVPMDTPEPAGWHVISTGDFFHKGYASGILFQHDNGGVAIWEMNGNTVVNPSGYLGVPQPAGWHALGTGDFFGIGYASDILFQHDNSDVAIWEMNGMVANELSSPGRTGMSGACATARNP
jgi:hypothetical protein